MQMLLYRTLHRLFNKFELTQPNLIQSNLILSGAGYEIESAQSVTKALQLAQSDAFQLYLIDLSFSDGSGIDFIEAIREFDRATPIVVCSGDAREAVQAEAILMGTQVFLTKPVDPDALAATVSAFAQLRRNR